MDTEHLKEFLVMARTKNYTATSEEMFMSQSSIFKHIRALEKELGVSLFVRDGKKVAITEYGEMFIQHASAILKEVDDYHAEVAANIEAQANVVTIINEYPDGDMIVGFHKKFPNYSIRELCPLSRDEVFDLDCEVSILRGDLGCAAEEYDYVDLTTDSAVLIVPKSHPAAQLKKVSIKKLDKFEFISLSQGYFRDDSFYSVEQVCKKAGIKPNVTMRAYPGSEVARLVSQGAGVSILFKKAIQRRVGDSVAYVDLDPEVRFPIRCYYKKNSKLSKPAKDFLEFAKEWYSQH